MSKDTNKIKSKFNMVTSNPKFANNKRGMMTSSKRLIINIFSFTFFFIRITSFYVFVVYG